jgi:hypothetical protein
VADLVRVAIVETEPEADVAVGLLRTEGIPAMRQPTGLMTTGGALGSVGGIMGPYEVLVHAENEVRARELLSGPS